MIHCANTHNCQIVHKFVRQGLETASCLWVNPTVSHCGVQAINRRKSIKFPFEIKTLRCISIKLKEVRPRLHLGDKFTTLRTSCDNFEMDFRVWEFMADLKCSLLISFGSPQQPQPIFRRSTTTEELQSIFESQWPRQAGHHTVLHC